MRFFSLSVLFRVIKEDFSCPPLSILRPIPYVISYCLRNIPYILYIRAQEQEYYFNLARHSFMRRIASTMFSSLVA